MVRFVLSILLHIPTVIRINHILRKSCKNKTLTLDQRYNIARRIVIKISRKIHCKVKTFGLENMPKENGYLVCPNHQGKFDGLAILNSSPYRLSFLIDNKRSDISIERYFTDLMGSKRVSKDNPKNAIKEIIEMYNEINSGKNYCVFLEGGYTNNKNNLQKFYTGALHFIQDSKVPIVPCCLYNTYKVYNTIGIGPVSCEVHYLKPITYDEYKDLTKIEIAQMIKDRIQAKLDELTSKRK